MIILIIAGYGIFIGRIAGFGWCVLNGGVIGDFPAGIIGKSRQKSFAGRIAGEVPPVLTVSTLRLPTV